MARGIIIFGSAGSMDSFNAPFVPLFDLGVHVTASVPVRIDRIHKRECGCFPLFQST